VARLAVCWIYPNGGPTFVKNILATIHVPSRLMPNRFQGVVKHLVAVSRQWVAYSWPCVERMLTSDVIAYFSKVPCHNLLPRATICFQGRARLTSRAAHGRFQASSRAALLPQNGSRKQFVASGSALCFSTGPSNKRGNYRRCVSA